MKKALLFAFILFLVLANVPVTKAERTVFPGIKLGGNLNWASWDPEPPLGEVKTGISYNLGGMEAYNEKGVSL